VSTAARRNYDLDTGSINIHNAQLPACLERVLVSKGYNTVESVYGLLVGAPDLFCSLVVATGPNNIDVGEIRENLKKLLSPEEIEALEQPVRRRRRGVIRP